MTRFNLPNIQFAEKSVLQIETDIVTRFENATGIKLSPADPRRKFIQAQAVLLAQQRSIIDYTGKQNLLGYASGDALDQAGRFTDTTRLPATPAKTTIRFYLSVAQQQIIPSGTRVTAGDGVFFATTQDVFVESGMLQVDVDAECTVTGLVGNGYLVGQISQMVDPRQWVQSVENTTVSEGGADVEDDDGLAERIRQAPESFSSAGPDGAYVYHARSASQMIVDVSVRSPSPGVVEIRPLMMNGELPAQSVLDLVEQACNDRKVRPLTDHVQVVSPDVINYNIDVTYWIHTDNSSIAASIQSQVVKAVDDYRLWQKSKLGRDIDPSELIARVKNAGAKRAAVTAPAYQLVERHQVAVETTVATAFGGLEDD